jgi:hypothetical protein
MKLKTILKGTIAAAAFGLALTGMSAPAQAAQVRCDSAPNGYNYCRTNTSGGVTLRYQHSRYGCYQNDTWGYDRRGIWVSNGCSATFRVGRNNRDDGKTATAVGLGLLALGILGAIASDDNSDQPPPPPEYDPNNPPPDQGEYDPYDPYGTEGGAYVISCDSRDYGLTLCPARIRNYVQLVQQRSTQACRFKQTWGYNDRAIWVNKGCRGEFAIY